MRLTVETLRRHLTALHTDTTYRPLLADVLLAKFVAPECRATAHSTRWRTMRSPEITRRSGERRYPSSRARSAFPALRRSTPAACAWCSMRRCDRRSGASAAGCGSAPQRGCARVRRQHRLRQARPDTHRPEALDALQLNLIRSHSVGVGEPLPAAVVRLMLALKAASLRAVPRACARGSSTR